ncbi:acyl-CoA dehydrogenase family protein [Brevibacterium sp. S111]|uniref:acyl-CoA dehydrogenase family protein n=1 Tax=Brevibacterium sp. S111 TaxID=2483795 RepID=UPI0010811179|nr:acyl-CoA dehydrogenase family protein [Brevibacterium sp. S111]TGD10468.1 acyl-CoA dehydrogenase [Brevibacterium sp. S111]
MSRIPTEVEQLRSRTRTFIHEVVIPAEPHPGDYLDEAVLAELKAKAKDAGVFAPHVPTEWGGQGVPTEFWSPIFQEAGYSPIGPAVLGCMAPDEGNMHMLAQIATQEQKERYLAPLAGGDVRSSFAMTEPHPGTGSDPSALTTRAVRDGDDWVITGDKRFISGAELCSFFIVMAATDPEDADGSATDGSGAAQAKKGQAATMFLVDRDTPGVTVGKPIHTVDRTIAGGHPYVHFDEVRVPASAILGEAGKGFTYAQVRLAPARLTHCMRWLGLARRALDTALDRAEHREAFGDILARQGLAQELIAQSVIDIETSEAMITKTAEVLDTDAKEANSRSSIAKVYCSEAVYRVIDRAIQLTGGDGVSDRLPLIQYLNDVRPFRIYDGATETHKFAISRRASSKRRRQVAAGAPRLDIVEEAR